MLKTMKYEVIRNKMVIIILFSILGAAEALFLFGLISDSKNMVGFGILGLVLGTSIIYFAIWLLGIMSFSHDLRDKTGYMVFLTPVSPYKIIIAKMLVGLCELIASALLLEKRLPLGYTYFYSPRGFVIDFYDSKLLSYFTEEIKKYIKKK